MSFYQEDHEHHIYCWDFVLLSLQTQMCMVYLLKSNEEQPGTQENKNPVI